MQEENVDIVSSNEPLEIHELHTIKEFGVSNILT